ncbi:unnamed protein product [Hydatigera taeniaeformis]|uniref:SCP domain-containing protein n=1 Tax=Hydatigena taeniaeformis TaxID=6205 RepID=A0A0R3WT72_HYDTA|nr:unnamed protein product [Hydatigera taeniaeformis]
MDVIKKAFCLIILQSAVAFWPTTDVERRQILEAHHRARESVKPPASNMKLMMYSKKLENLAARWASRCVFEHPDRNTYPEYRELGQNLALAAGFTPNITEAACGWRSEIKFYDSVSGRCRHVCGHYTQMIWASSSALGCAMWRCDGVRPDWHNPQYITACQYSPPGNYIGSKPYIQGRSCSRCSPGEQCYRNQCARNARHNQVYPLAKFKSPRYRSLPPCKLPQSYSTFEYG